MRQNKVKLSHRIWLVAFAYWLAPVLSAEIVRLATYNLANYNLTNRQIEGAFLTAYPKPEKEKTALRQVIHAMDADILALQEIGDEDFLRELQRDLRKEGLNYPEAIVMSGVDEQRKVAVLSRLPLTEVRRHSDLDFKYFEGRELVKRGMLEVRFDTMMGEVALFVVHFKSRLTERRDDPQAKSRRGKEATAARDRILELFPEVETARFIVAGDFNEGPLHRPVRAFSRIGVRPISTLISAEDSRGETWTYRHWRNDGYSRVDFVMVSSPLVAAVKNGKGMIPDTPEVLSASDHRPVVMNFEFHSLATDEAIELTK